jgi:uncharacterized membrane protein YdjX (TVP38/TMEM64 family)
MRKSRFFYVYLGAALALWLAYYATPVSNESLLGDLKLLEAQARAYPVLVALLLLVASAGLAGLAFPAMPLVYLAGGYSLGVAWGGLSTLIGSAIGGLCAFLLYRDQIPQRHRMAEHGHAPVKLWLSLLGLRLSPILPAPLVNFCAAFFNVSPAQHFTTTLLGSAPLILCYAQLGEQGRVLVAGGPLRLQSFTLYAVILAVSTVLTVLGPWRAFLSKIRRVKDEALAGVTAPSPSAILARLLAWRRPGLAILDARQVEAQENASTSGP